MPLRLLAIESTSQTGSIALLESGQVIAEQPLDPDQRTAQSLAPGMQQALANAGWRPQQIDVVAVTIGPGSFTGLRVGVTTAKTFAYAAGCDLLGINSLDVLAEQIPHVGTIAAVMDAQRGEVYARTYRRAEQALPEPQGETRILAADDWLAELAAGTVVTGPILRRLAERVPQGIEVADSGLWQPRSATVGLIASRDYEAGRRDDMWQLVPLYLRLSAAEEKWQRQQ